MDEFPAELVADLQGGQEPADIIGDMTSGGDEEGGCWKGAAMAKGEVVEEKGDSNVVVNNPGGGEGRRGGMHDEGGGVVEIEGEDDEKECVGEG